MKRIDTLQKFRKLFGVLVVAVAVAMLILLLGLAHVLNQSRLRYYAAAEETSRNLAITLEGFLQANFLEVDLAMQRANAEFQSMHAAGTYTDQAFSAYLRSLKERVPQAQAVRGADASGRVIYGDDVDLSHPYNLSVREFFHRARLERKLTFGLPVQSRISGQWVLPVAYPLTLPDGSFGGTVYVTIDSATLDQSFSALKIGAHGSIVLLDVHKRVLHRYPQVAGMEIGSNIKVNPPTQEILDGKRQRGTFTVISARDQLERTLSMEQVGHYPVYVVVGLASEDFLAPWHRKEIRNVGIFMLLMLVLAVALLMSLRVGLRKQSHSVQQLVEAEDALQQSLVRLTASESRWRSLTEGLPQMVWTARADLRLDFLSHHWEQFSGIAAQEMMGDGNWSRVIHPDDIDTIAAEWRLAKASGREFRCDARLRRHDGVWRVFDHHALAQHDGHGTVQSWVGSSTDRTESRAAREALLQAKEEALKAGRAKTEFVANMSHEIRSPMNAVLGMLQLLQQTGMNQRQQDYVAKASSAAKALLGLLNDILDFSKVEAGKLALDPHPFHFDQLWRDLAVIVSANVGAKQVEVLFHIDPALPAVVIGDDLRLQQILLNLAGNAIKFTERGEVVVSARLAARSDTRLSVCFAIRDTGIGISDEQRQRIFDGFSQAEASTARRYGGTGLGLAISQRLVALMGGQLGVHSTVGEGSIFDFTLEFELGDDVTPTLAAPDTLSDLACLVVDDNHTARAVLGEMAASCGWRVDLAADGVQALAMIAARIAAGRGYDMVFIDWRMPELDGWETSCRIRQLDAVGKLSLIVMVSAYDREMLAQRQQDLSPVLDGVVVKPVTASMLRDAATDARLEYRLHQSRPAVPMPAGARLARLRLLLVDDNPANQQVASELLANDGAQVAVASSGRLALQALLGQEPLPDLILMDIQMPDMDGYQTTQAILQQLGPAAPPIVAMTANAMAADRTAALNAGMVDHVGKPFDLAQLIEVILRHVGRGDGVSMPLRTVTLAGVVADADVDADGNGNGNGNGNAANDGNKANAGAGATNAGVGAGANVDSDSDSAVDHAAAGLPAPGINSQAALRRMGGLKPVYLMALRGFEGEAARLCAQIDTARQAHTARNSHDGHAAHPDYDGHDEYNNHPAQAALASLHTLKGLAGTIGAERLQALARAAEIGLKNQASEPAWERLGPVLDEAANVAREVAALAAELAQR